MRRDRIVHSDFFGAMGEHLRRSASAKLASTHVPIY
jgi:hypothetical protein